MMRYITLLPLLFYFHSICAQIYEVEVVDLENISLLEKKRIKSLTTSESVSVYVHSKLTDSLFFRMINDYRQIQPTPMLRLEFSIRLDTLARIVAQTIGQSGKLAHYPAFPELKPISDLLNIENIAYNASSEGFNRTSFDDANNSNDIVSLQKLLTRWMKSPSHNRNMLADFRVGTAKVVLRVTVRNESYFIETIALYEADYIVSKRELNERVKKKNMELHRLPNRRTRTL